ncbi:hypothetical protein GIB67_031154 [Kingdonia uniflora]|uniref:Prolamin-like domain-containing protein n=1 Tax=Kingdonia uniflora TaxID=39325 RepID=A0A7J7NJZ0_9MAGN|nr:hypothetical protein GIB67_031154 [Kingdonia uniflora]
MNIKPLPGHNLAARLNTEGEGGFGDCLNALFEIKSCTNEVDLFFLNGEGYIGQECCRSIRIIIRRCWPSMFTSQQKKVIFFGAIMMHHLLFDLLVLSRHLLE